MKIARGLSDVEQYVANGAVFKREFIDSGWIVFKEVEEAKQTPTRPHYELHSNKYRDSNSKWGTHSKTARTLGQVMDIINR